MIRADDRQQIAIFPRENSIHAYYTGTRALLLSRYRQTRVKPCHNYNKYYTSQNCCAHVNGCGMHRIWGLVCAGRCRISVSSARQHPIRELEVLPKLKSIAATFISNSTKEPELAHPRHTIPQAIDWRRPEL